MKEHNLHLLRVNDNGDSTIGSLYRETQFAGYTLEDEHRDIKIKGETRIPAGRYKLVLRKVLSGMTQRYRKRYPWFTWHIMLQDVKTHKYVYIHSGSFESHTDGCILVGWTQSANIGDNGSITESRHYYERLYKEIVPLLESDTDEVYINIHDENLIKDAIANAK